MADCCRAWPHEFASRLRNTEYGQGQLEITFAPKFGIEAADMTATFRTGTKEMLGENRYAQCYASVFLAPLRALCCFCSLP